MAAKKKAAAPQALTPEEVLDALEAQIALAPTQNTDTAAATAWLQDFRLPLASLTTNSLVGVLQGFLNGKTDEQLKLAYLTLTPDELNAVISGNADSFKALKSAASREALVWQSAKNKLTMGAASFLMAGMSAVLKIPLT